MNTRTSRCSLALSILLLCLFAPLFSTAQGTPQYIKKQSYALFPGGWIYNNAGGSLDTPARGRKIQLIYYDSDFTPKPISGEIKNIYFWVRGANLFRMISTIYNVEIKMGYTQRDSFKRISSLLNGVRDTFITGLTTVFKADSVQEDLLNVWSYWWKFPLMGNGFHYNASTEQNLVVEFDFGVPMPNGWIVFSDSSSMNTDIRVKSMYGYRDSAALQQWPTNYQISTAGGNLDFGFDLVPGSVPSLGSRVDMQLYPNPSSGKFQMRIQSAGELHEVQLTV
ncbi:MAG: hypothetical protein JST27_10935, partial [Bacteroidetes bacterium]|nr:hypothetical protein [Bacteroidota bacterium]